MKFSKVKENYKGEKLTVNARSAVVSEDRIQEGILYNDPSRYGKSRKDDVDRDHYINSRLHNTERLYQIFNEDKSKKQKNDISNELIKALRGKEGIFSYELLKDNISMFEKYAEQSYKNRKEHISESPSFEECGADSTEAARLKYIISEQNFIDRIKKRKINGKVDEDCIDTIIARYLKKSLCREKIKNGLKKLLMDAYGIPYNKSDVNIQRDFIDYVLEDFFHVRTKAQVSRSIKNMNMPVQPTEEGILDIAVSKGGTDSGNRRSEEKQAFRKFLSDYASLDRKVREDLLRRLRRLVVLYFYGTDDALLSDANEEFDVWEDHSVRRGDKFEFVALPPIKRNSEGKIDKDAERIRKDTVKVLYREKNISCYRQAVKAIEVDNGRLFFEDSMLNMFFLHRIEYGVEKIYSNLKEVAEFKTKTGYISEKIWKDLINYMSVKYIAIGKAVYNYAMDELNKSEDQEIELGKISEEYISGISSFDYELIKAEEMLQRETAVYVAFAARHLSAQTVSLDEEHSDFLLLKSPKSKKDDQLTDNNILCFIKDKDSLRRNILQYFGGQSLWRDFSFEKEFSDGYDYTYFLNDLKDIIYSMRNDSFHYTTENHNEGRWNMNLIKSMFEYETKRMTDIWKDKFYSNNLPMFYKNEDLKKLLIDLYKDNVERASQVPSFNKVFVRKNFPVVVCDKNGLGIELKLPADGDKEDSILKFYNALYYMFKEIYYNAFLNDKTVRERFIKMATMISDNYDRNIEYEIKNQIRQAVPNEKEKYREKLRNYIAENDFGQYIRTIIKIDPDYSLSQICQIIMTEYNQQNNGYMKKKSVKCRERNKDIYKHYKMLLLLNLKNAFIEFIKEKYSFILKPFMHNLCDKNNFIPEFSDCISPYSDIVKKIADSAELQKWYIVSRFLSPAQVNHMLGSLHNYRQYVWDIYRRASETGVKINHSISENEIAGINISDIDTVIDLSVKLCGTISSDINDYFKDEEEYAYYISSFLDFEYDGGSYKDSLQAFCNSDAIKGQKVELYYDAENPRLNRNIILSKLYGEEKFLERMTDRVGRNEIIEYYKLKKEIRQYQNKGIYDNEVEQKSIKKFQELKNYVEFRDLMEYSEIADELQGQLINWIYLRERDLMYFQLGYHYACMNNDKAKPEAYMTIDYHGKKKNKEINKKINGAILYQICAVYINGLPVYYNDKETGVLKSGDGPESTGTKIGQFYCYARSLKNCDKCYESGLELFENINEHENIIQLRNHIEHFRYYTAFDRSFLDLYSEIFDRFFTYDLKYRKNVPNILYNILLQHFVNIRIEFESGKKIIGKEENRKEKECANITVRKKNGIESEVFTYKLKDGSQIQVDARDKRYLQTVIRVLFYPDTDKVNLNEMIGEKKANTGTRDYKNRERQTDRDNYKKYKEKKKKEGNYLGGMAGNIDWDALIAATDN